DNQGQRHADRYAQRQRRPARRDRHRRLAQVVGRFLGRHPAPAIPRRSSGPRRGPVVHSGVKPPPSPGLPPPQSPPPAAQWPPPDQPELRNTKINPITSATTTPTITQVFEVLTSPPS